MRDEERNARAVTSDEGFHEADLFIIDEGQDLDERGLHTEKNGEKNADDDREERRLLSF